MSRFNSENIANHIIDWLKNYTKDIPVKGFVLGVSGGLDSAVVAALCARTEMDVLLLSLPIHQSSSENLRAEKQILELVKDFSNVKSLKIDLSDLFDSFKTTLPSSVQVDDLALANSRSRLRMTTMYAIGQANQLLVTGTGNKIEDYAIGFFTKYGDGGVDINPIGDLLKSEVYHLARYLNITQEILEAKPTDGLWGDSRSDEDQIGATYDELEFVFNYKGNGEDLSARQQDVLSIYKRLNAINQHKIIPIPVCDISKFRE